MCYKKDESLFFDVIKNDQIFPSKVCHLMDRIIYKKTDEWYNEWQRVVQRVTTSGTTSDNEWQLVTTNDNEWYNEWQRVTRSGTTSDYEWQRVTTSDNEWLRVITNDNE